MIKRYLKSCLACEQDNLDLVVEQRMRSSSCFALLLHGQNARTVMWTASMATFLKMRQKRELFLSSPSTPAGGFKIVSKPGGYDQLCDCGNVRGGRIDRSNRLLRTDGRKQLPRLAPAEYMLTNPQIITRTVALPREEPRQGRMMEDYMKDSITPPCYTSSAIWISTSTKIHNHAPPITWIDWIALTSFDVREELTVSAVLCHDESANAIIKADEIATTGLHGADLVHQALQGHQVLRSDLFRL